MSNKKTLTKSTQLKSKAAVKQSCTPKAVQQSAARTATKNKLSQKLYAPSIILNGLTYQEALSGKLVGNIVNPYDLHLYKSKAGALSRAQELAKAFKRSDHAHASVVGYTLEV